MRIRLACFVAMASVACGGGTRGASATDAGGARDVDAVSTAAPDGACVPSDAAPAAAPVGAPCVPNGEKNPEFSGFSLYDLDREFGGPECASQLCLINKFNGRVSCPYGQNASGQGPDGTPGCKAPGSCDPVTVPITPQCATRTAADAVYCSCRCANADGKTDDGATYCTCPGTMTCSLTVPPFGDAGPVAQGGTYCVKANTELDAGIQPSCSTSCDPTKSPCP